MEKSENFKSELETQYTILIKANERKEKQRFTIVLIILAITLLSVFTSIFFAYKAFSSTKGLEKEIEEGETYYHTLSATFNDGPRLNLTNIGNGFELSTPKVIQLSNEGNSDIDFSIKLTGINTSLLSTNNLVYTIINNGNTSVAKELPLTEKEIVSDITITPGTTLEFIIKVQFKGVIEEGDYSNYYNANIVIEQINNNTTLLE